jgi:5-keto 4-deoxyuronate isomerase
LISGHQVVAVTPNARNRSKFGKQLTVNGKAVKDPVVPLHDFKRWQPQFGLVCHLEKSVWNTFTKHIQIVAPGVPAIVD